MDRVGGLLEPFRAVLEAILGVLEFPWNALCRMSTRNRRLRRSRGGRTRRRRRPLRSPWGTFGAALEVPIVCRRCLGRRRRRLWSSLDGRRRSGRRRRGSRSRRRRWRSVLGPSGRRLGPSWGALGSFRGALGAILEDIDQKRGELQLALPLGNPTNPLLDPSWGALGRSWGRLGALLGISWGPLGPS